MRYPLNGPFKEYRNKRGTDKLRSKLTETTQITKKDNASEQDVTERIFPLKHLFLKLIFPYHNTLAAGLNQVRNRK